MLLSRQAFEQLVVEALEELPPEIAAALDNVEIVVEREPRYRHRRAAGIARGTLYGLYEGIPLTERVSSYNLVPPDVITIFQGPICRTARTIDEVRQIVRDTVIHEVAHHFGITDERLRQLGRY